MRRNSRNKKNSTKSFLAKLDTKKVIAFTLIAFLIFLITFVCTKLYFISHSNSALDYEINKLGSHDSSKENENSNLSETQESKETSEKNTSTTFRLGAIGDVLCHNTQYWDAYNSETGEYDFSYVFEDISRYTRTPDLVIGSLETSFAGEERGYSNYPTFNSPDNLAVSLKKIGVDILSTAGNHCLDMGFSGLSRTIDVLDNVNISHLGTYKTQEDQKQILYKYVKGVKIAFINYTYGTNGIPVPSGKEFCVNLIDKTLIKEQIDLAKSEGADVIVACMHWGTEYRTTANSEQKELADFLFQNGVNVILGNHPHTLEPMEKRTVTLEDGSTQDGFVIYALGNFTGDQNAENTRNSIILDLTITKNTDGKITIDKVEYTPIYMYKNSNAKSKKFKVLDIEKTIALYEDGSDTSIGKAKYEDLKVQLNKIKSIVGEEIYN